MIISNRNQIENINISLSGQPIARTSNHKFLGVFIDDKLKFDIHINKLCSKVSQSIGIMRRISHLVPLNVLRNLYNTLIYSRLTYAITAWGSAFNSTTRRIESLISRAITLVTDQSNTNQSEMRSKFIQFKGVYDYFVLCKMYRIIHERKHEHFTIKIDNQVIAHEHETRSRVNNKLVPPRYTKSKCQNALIFRGIRLWNTTPNDIKQSANLARFKKYLKRYLLNSSENPDI